MHLDFYPPNSSSNIRVMATIQEICYLLLQVMILIQKLRSLIAKDRQKQIGDAGFQLTLVD